MTTLRLADESVYDALRSNNCLYPQELGHHFVGVSGKHLAGYCNVDPVLPQGNLLMDWMEELTSHFEGIDPAAIFTSAVGGIPLAVWTSYALWNAVDEMPPHVWADKAPAPDGKGTIPVIERAGFAELLTGDVFIVEDMINQMHTTSGLVRLVRECGGNVLGIGSIASNSQVSAEGLDVPKVVSLTDFSYDAWRPEACELCAAGVPVVTDDALGHGAKWLADNAEYTGGGVQLLSA